MKKIFLFLFFLEAVVSLHAQQIKRHKIALVAPLYLDSAFDGSGDYKFDKTFPKYLNSGIEFYLGAQAALDSLNKVGAPLEVYVIDSRSATENLSSQMNSVEMNDVEMIIANANATDVRSLAESAERKKIPFISATLPNDAGVTSNPYVVVLNSTLRSHCEAIYRYIQKYHGLDKVIKVFTKPGTQEGQIKEYFREYAKNTRGVPLKMDFVEVGNNFDAATLAASLDSNEKNVCIAGSLDEVFGNRLLQQLGSISKSYEITVAGMPTWDAINLSKPEYKSMEVFYSTPFNYSRPNSLATRIANEFSARQVSRPTDMFYRGYESMLRFGLLLLDTKQDVASSLARKGNNIFTSFDIQPVFLDRNNLSIDYYENRNLYFIRWMNGIKSVL
jgi:hypothetical protein